MSLEGMRRMRREQQESDKAEAFKDPVSGEKMSVGEHDKTLDQVMQSNTDQSQFFEFLGTLDKRRAAGIVDAFSVGRIWTDSQQDFLNTSLKDYNVRRAELEKLDSVVTSEYVRNMADANKNIANIVAQIGLDRTHALLTSQLHTIGYKDPKEYKKIVDSIRGEKKVSENPHSKYIDARAQHYLQRLGVPEAEIGKYVRKSMEMRSNNFDSTERSALIDTAQKNMSVLMKFANFVRRGKIAEGRADSYIHEFKKQRQYLHDGNDFLSQISQALNATITKEQRQEMQRILVEGGEMKDVPETNVNTLQEYKPLHEKFSEKARNERFKSHMKAELKKLKKGPNAVSTAEKDKIKNDFIDSEFSEQEKHKGSGLFAALLKLIFGTKADLKKEVDKIW